MGLADTGLYWDISPGNFCPGIFFRGDNFNPSKSEEQDLSRKCSAWKVFSLGFCLPPPLLEA